MVIFHSYVKLPEGKRGDSCGEPEAFRPHWDEVVQSAKDRAS